MNRDQTRPTPISVIVPVFNAGEHLRTCFDSLLAQTLPGIEIIAVDDCSTDGSAEALERLEAAGKLRLLRQPRNGGPSAARNAGIQAATGEFIGFVDADDVVSPTMFEDLYRATERGADIASCAIQLVDGAGQILSTVPFPLAPGRVHHPEEVREELQRAFETKLPWFHVRNLYRRSLLADNGLMFDESIRKGEDSVFNLHAFALARGCVAIPDAHYSYRKHPASATAKPLASEAENLERLGHAVRSFYAEAGYGQRAYDDFHRHVLRSDLPTAIMRLATHPAARVEIRALLETDTACSAFASISLWTLAVPVMVKILLLLAKRGWVAAILALLRAGNLVRTR